MIMKPALYAALVALLLLPAEVAAKAQKAPKRKGPAKKDLGLPDDMHDSMTGGSRRPGESDEEHERHMEEMHEKHRLEEEERARNPPPPPPPKDYTGFDHYCESDAVVEPNSPLCTLRGHHVKARARARPRGERHAAIARSL